MQGRVTEYVLGVRDLSGVDEIAEGLRKVVGADYQITTWRDVDPATRDRTLAVRWILGFVALVLSLLVATGIVNTMLMSVYERVREIGTMLAVGVKRRQVMMLFVWEAVGLGLIGSCVGVSAGVALIAVLGRRGLSIRPPGSDVSVLFPHVSWAFVGLVVAFAVVGAVASAVYPARRAAKLRPVEALRAT
jgi:putative ABC transport system permease protein